MDYNNIAIIAIIVVAVAAVFGISYIAIPLLIRKGVNVEAGIDGTGKVLNAADYVVDTARGFFPGVPALAIVDEIIAWAKNGVEAAEQLYKTSNIESEQRKEKATEIVYQYIEAAGVEMTDDMRKIIDGSIEAAVFALPKTNKEIDPGDQRENEWA